MGQSRHLIYQPEFKAESSIPVGFLKRFFRACSSLYVFYSLMGNRKKRGGGEAGKAMPIADTLAKVFALLLVEGFKKVYFFLNRMGNEVD